MNTFKYRKDRTRLFLAKGDATGSTRILDYRRILKKTLKNVNKRERPRPPQQTEIASRNNYERSPTDNPRRGLPSRFSSTCQEDVFFRDISEDRLTF
ncbi:hypothetical protein AVEN_12334-1 [Araneus ventricosus]|uniref:Uncharacterized protein n=1 Tax=Araneus ventricosus TaxID=182803 RepID=A0A4Y2KXD9_ARAVE|nr:hypothetical protein AVEN_12334-1 [Araneus ventricosus]